MRTPPSRAATFAVLGWSVSPDQQAITARYACSSFGDFSETFRFPGGQTALQTLLTPSHRGIVDLLTVAAGVSYYKVGAATQIALPPLTPQARAMAEALYTEGLAEFFLRAGLPWPAEVSFSGDTRPGTERAPPSVPAGPALVAFGGGKDSYVARAVLQAADVPVTLASVTLSDALKPVLSATAPTPIRFLDRRLDPRLAEASQSGFNGHVPITAINMLMLCADAAMSGAGQVVFANERSADEPTTLTGSAPANHQYSKSGAFERLIRAALASMTEAAPIPYSVLRPFSELWIGSVFSRIDEAFPRFTSCNKNFRLAADASQRWCGSCAKCAFTSLIVAPFASQTDMQTMFGGDFLNKDALQPYRRDILGLGEQKPWDCVGTIAEARAALWKTSHHPGKAQSLAVRELLPRVLDRTPQESLDRDWITAMTPHKSDIVPSAYLDAAARISS